MTINDNTSVTLTWNAPEAKEGSAVEGYNVEMRSSNNLSWTKCNIFPIETTTYKVKGLQTKGTYFLRVRAINDCGPGEATELEACTEAVPRVGRSITHQLCSACVITLQDPSKHEEFLRTLTNAPSPAPLAISVHCNLFLDYCHSTQRIIHAMG